MPKNSRNPSPSTMLKGFRSLIIHFTKPFVISLLILLPIGNFGIVSLKYDAIEDFVFGFAH